MGFFMILMNSFDKFRAVNKFDKCLLLAESCKFHSTKILAPKICMKEIIKAQDLDAIFVGDSFGIFCGRVIILRQLV